MSAMIEGTTLLQRTLSPRFIAHALDFRVETKHLLAEEGSVCLWRFRPEWKGLAKADGMASLSKNEASRVARFAKSPASKRFAVQRAVLRTLLASVTGIDARSIEIVEDVDGGMSVASHEGKLHIGIAHAGLWIIIGLSRAPLGLGAAIETFLSVDAEQSPHAWPALRAQVRRASLLHVGIEINDDMLFDAANASFSFHDLGHTWHIADIPMMESTLLTLAAPYPLSCVHGFGWASNVTRRVKPPSPD